MWGSALPHRPGGDLDRARRQQVFLSSLAHTVLSSTTLTDATTRAALLAAVGKALAVGRSLGVLSLAGQLPGLVAGSIAFHTIPIVNAAYDTPDDGEVVRVDPNAVQDYISATLSGSAAPTSPSTTPDAGGAASGSSARAAQPTTGAAPAVPSSDAGTTAPTVPCIN